MLILQDYGQLEKLFEQGTQWLMRLLKDKGGQETQPFEMSVRQIDTIAKLLMCEKLDRYLACRIETDKVLIGILKDIQNNTAALSMTMDCINNVGIVCHDGKDAFLQKGNTVMDEINKQDTGNQAEPENMDPAPAEQPPPHPAEPETPAPAEPETPAPAEPETPAPAEPEPKPAQEPEKGPDSGSGIT